LKICRKVEEGGRREGGGGKEEREGEKDECEMSYVLMFISTNL